MLIVILILQAFIIGSKKYSSSHSITLEDSLTYALNNIEAKKVVSTKKQIKYFKFNPNKLEYSYWQYFGLQKEQLYKLDSFRAVSLFSNYTQVRDVLSFNSKQDSIFSKYIYFDKKYPRKEWKKEKKLFLFNPNVLTNEGWESLSFSKKQSEIIVSYINKYGPIESKKELGNIFVIDEEKLNILWPYIELPDSVEKKKIEKNINLCEPKDLSLLCDLNKNEADAILKYRNKLGGFYSIYQVKEVRSVSISARDSVLQVFYVEKNYLPPKLNINELSLEELENHPYINRGFAKKIYDFRTNFRDFNSLEELRNIESLSDTYFDKIALYLSAD